MHIVDLVFYVIFCLYMWRSLRTGLSQILSHVLIFFIGLLVAFSSYQRVGSSIARLDGSVTPVSYMVSFVLILFFTEVIAYIIVKKFIVQFLEPYDKSLTARIITIIPAFIESYIFVVLSVTVISVIPQGAGIKNSVADSFTGHLAYASLAKTDAFAQKYLGINVEQSLTHLAIRPQDDASVKISYHPSTLTVDTHAEEQMLVLINNERAKVGVQPLVLDEKLTEVARAHSQDMWQRGYFSHINPDGKDPFQRLLDAHIDYFTAGENVAFSANVQVAHTGLMNSEEHRKNILNPDFHKIGLGIVSGGIYGEMFSQEFTN